MPSTPTPGVSSNPQDPMLTSTHHRTTWVQRVANPKSVHALVAPLFVVGMVVLADSCTCPLLSLFGSPKTQHGSITLPKSSVTPGGAAVRPALVQHAFQHLDSGTSNALKLKQDVHFPDLIVVAITTAQMLVNTVTDNSNDVYTRVGQPVVANPPDQRNHVHLELWYAVGTPGTHTVIVSFASPPANAPPDSDVGIYEFESGQANQSLHYEKTVAAVGFDNQPDAGRLQSSVANQEVIYFVVGGDGGPAPGTGSGNTPVKAGPGYTLLDQQDEPDFIRFYTEVQIAPQGTYNTNFTLAYSSNWGVIGAAFRP